MTEYSRRTMDRFTLVTGASTGIGKELAHVCAENGRDLVLLARSQDKLEALGKTLQDRNSVRVEIVARDLAAPNAVERTRSEVEGRGLEIGTLINNAQASTGEIPYLTGITERVQTVAHTCPAWKIARGFVTLPKF